MASMRRCASRSVLNVDWHPVAKQMSKIGYDGGDCAIPVKLVSQQQRSVASFFKPRGVAGAAAGESGGKGEGSSSAQRTDRSNGSQGRSDSAEGTGVKRHRDDAGTGNEPTVDERPSCERKASVQVRIETEKGRA
jgi:hypothetical protein